MRGRTNYTGGAIPVINGEIKNYEIAAGSTISKGDFVELIWEYKLKPLFGYNSSAQRVIRLSGGTFIVAVRATTGYQWTIYAVEIVNGKPVVKNTFVPTIGSGSVLSSEDLQLASLENNRFAYNAVRADNYLGVCTILLKYENETITFLSKQYYYDGEKYRTNPDNSPIAVCSNKRIVSTWGDYFVVLSYNNDELTILSGEYLKATGSASGYYSNQYFLSVPSNKNQFIVAQVGGVSSSYIHLMELGDDNLVVVKSRAEIGTSEKPLPHNIAFIDDKRFLLLSGYANSGYTYYNELFLVNTNGNTVSVTSEESTQTITGMPSNRSYSAGGAVASLGGGYFVMAEGIWDYSAYNKKCYFSLGYVDSVGVITIIDCVEVKNGNTYPWQGDGCIIVSDDDICFYVEDDSANKNTSYAAFKIVNKDHISSIEDKVYIKEYSKRAEGFANQSGIGGETIEIYVPKSK